MIYIESAVAYMRKDGRNARVIFCRKDGTALELTIPYKEAEKLLDHPYGTDLKAEWSGSRLRVSKIKDPEPLPDHVNVAAEIREEDKAAWKKCLDIDDLIRYLELKVRGNGRAWHAGHFRTMPFIERGVFGAYMALQEVFKKAKQVKENERRTTFTF